MKIKIKSPGRYLGNDLKARDCKAGAVLETKGWYAQELILKGFAVEYVPPAEPSPEEPPAEEKPEEKAPEPKRSSRKRNPFLGN